MGKIVLFLPNREMLGQAMQILQNREYSIDVARQVDTENILEEAKEAVREGADVLIARGNQAMLIKQSLTVPVVDIRATGQEMALLLTEAKRVSGKERPEIAVIASQNMLPDTTHLGEIYGVEIRVYIAQSNVDIRLLVRKIAKKKPDVIIGGSNVIKAAEEFQIKTVYFSLTQDGLRESFRVAEMMQYARDIEKKSNAQIKALTAHSFTGILRMDKDGMVILTNDLMKNILQKRERDIVGKQIMKLFPDLEEREMKRVMEEEGQIHNTYMVINDQAVNLIVTPIVVEEEKEGLILFCLPVKKLQKSFFDSEKYSRRSCYTFEDILHRSQNMQRCLHLARSYIQSASPILISGEPGTEKRELAEVLYHCSEYKYGPFVAINCSALHGDQQGERLFGNGVDEGPGGAVKQAEKGVLLLQNIDSLTEKNQARLFEMMNYGLARGGKAGEMCQNIRLLATGTEVAGLVEEGLFSAELYYLIGGLTLEIPPLRERKEDMEYALDRYFDTYKKKYNRYFSLTKGARRYILGQPWYGNFIQLERFCERTILASDSRIINEEFARSMTMKMAVNKTAPSGIKTVSEKERILGLLEKHHGDRQAIADEMGTSKVTLWRRMKKYGIL